MYATIAAAKSTVRYSGVDGEEGGQRPAVAPREQERRAPAVRSGRWSVGTFPLRTATVVHAAAV
jgi:hypothetical protein